MINKLIYSLLFGVFWLFASLPFPVLYLFSDFLFLVLYRLIGYRKDVVRTNLQNSFPERSTKELRAIEKEFYHYLCDYFVEEIKTLRLSEAELQQRMVYLNQEEFLRCIEQYGGAILLIPHYANFEWIMGVGTILNEGDVPVQVYKPLRNKLFDKLFRHIRSRYGGYNVEKHATVRELVRLYRANKKMAVGLIADQNPSTNDARFWTTFLNQETVFMDGGERIAKMLKFPVFYGDIERIQRGYCQMTFKLLAEDPKKTAEGEITEAFARHIEKTIYRNPPYWFWSHKRWKHKREEAV